MEKPNASEQVSQQVLSAIKERHLSPRPRWQFWLSNGLWWLAAALALILGSLAVSLIIYSFTANDWQWAKYTGGWLYLALAAIPVLWLAAGALLIGFGDFNLHQTKKAYRWHRGYILLAVLVLSGVLGLAMERVGLARELDEVLTPNLPEELIAPAKQETFWHQPAKGLITGTILNIDDDKSITVKDYNGENWQVDISQTVWPKNLKKEAGQKIKIFGSGEEESFEAKELSPWHSALKTPRRAKPVAKPNQPCPPERNGCSPRINNQ
jgi:hypothetical protein